VSLAERLAGARFRYPDHYEVEREKIREYAHAVKSRDGASLDVRAAAKLGYGGLVAPLTYISVFGHTAISAFFEHVGIVVSDAQIVQVDQRLAFHQPIKEGDRLYCDIEVESVRRAHGTDIISRQGQPGCRSQGRPRGGQGDCSSPLTRRQPRCVRFGWA